jgi:O-6-methylguanine DNA methyltransferase
MTERLRNALESYRTNTQRACSKEFTANTLDRLGLADRYTMFDSALGNVYVAWSPRGISALRQAENPETFERWFQKRLRRRAFPASKRSELAEIAARALAGEKVDFPVDLRDCTPFEEAVLQKAREIPEGHARPYAWIAREIEHPRAVRAVGSALANNPIPLLIPCHRVVRSDYTTGDYVFGTPNKRRLLEGEGLHLDAIADLARRGVRYIGQPEDNCFCLPTCGTNVISPQHPCFHSAEEALEMGLEPCSVCRPIAA